MTKQNSLTAVARISKLYGAGGEVVLRLFDSFPESVNIEEPLFIICDELTVPLFFSSFVPRGRDKAVAVFDDLDSELRVSEFIGYQLFMKDIEDEECDDDDQEIYYEDLVGYTMFDLNSHRKGKIKEFIEYENNPVFAVDFDGVEVMVPACDDIVQDIYPDALVVEVDMPDGLYDFYKDHSK